MLPPYQPKGASGRRNSSLEEEGNMAKAPKRKAAKKKSKAKAKAKTKEMLLVASKVKLAIRGHKMNVAGDAPEALNGVVHWYIEQAANRAAANGRKTVRAHDFIAY
jgi:histone H3/H4